MSEIVKLSQSIVREYPTAGSTGAPTNWDSTPTLTLLRNGIADGTVTVTHANAATGRQRFSFTVPAGYSAHDSVAVRADGAVGSVSVGGIVWAGVVAPQVTLADDAITAGKFDEATAHPVKSADTGATQIARVGADGDTLETLSDQLDGVHNKTTNLPSDPADQSLVEAAIDEAFDGLEVALSDAALAEIGGLLRGIRATISQLPLRGQNREFVQGDDHLDANGTGIEWSISNASGLADMTSWSVRLRLVLKGETTVSSWASITVATGATRSGTIDWENIASDLTKLGVGEYRLEFLNASDKEITLVRGQMELLSRSHTTFA